MIGSVQNTTSSLVMLVWMLNDGFCPKLTIFISDVRLDVDDGFCPKHHIFISDVRLDVE